MKIFKALTINNLYILLLSTLFCLIGKGVYAQTANTEGLLAGASSTPTVPTPNTQPISQWITPAQKPLSERLPFLSTRLEWEAQSIGHILQQSAPSIPQTPIGHYYYVDNLFAIEESDNPFALRRSNNPIKKSKAAQEVNSPSLWEGVAGLFTNQDKKSNFAETPSWLMFFLLSALGFLAVMMSIFRQDIFKLFAAFVNSTAAGQLYREQKNDLLTPVGMSAYGLFGLVMGSFTFLASQQLAGAEASMFNNFALFLLSVGGILAIYMLKHLQIKAIGWVFPFRQEMDFYNFLISNHNKVLGITFLPIVFMLAYTSGAVQQFALYMGMIAWGGMYLHRGLRAMSVSSDWIFSHKFHFFIYLCTAEIAPLVILIKLLSVL